MKKLLNILGVIGLIVTILTGLYGLYHELVEDKSPAITIRTEKVERGIQVAKMEGLQASYTFNKRPVGDLWIIESIITNTGEQSLIGKGDRKNIMDNSINLEVIQPYRILSSLVEPSFAECTSEVLGDTSLSIKFSQWRANELVKIRLYVEGDTTLSVKPALLMSDRQIIDGKILFSDYRNSLYGEKPMLKDGIKSRFISDFTGVMALYSALAIILLVPIMWVNLVLKASVYRYWYDKNFSQY